MFFFILERRMRVKWILTLPGAMGTLDIQTGSSKGWIGKGTHKKYRIFFSVYITV